MIIPKSKGQSHSQCRLCGKKIRKGSLIFKEKNQDGASSSSELNLPGVIFDCLRLKVCEDDVLPKLICFDCEKKLGSWLSFFTKCKETQEALQKEYNIPIDKTDKDEEENDNSSNNDWFQSAVSSPPKPESTTTTTVVVAETTATSSNNKPSTSDDTLPPKHTCPLCSKTFAKRSLFAQHLASHVKPDPGSPNLWPCPLCNKKLRSCEGLARHQETHLESRNFCCHVCGKLFQTLSCLLHHVRIQHSPETGPDARPRHACSVCGKEFRQSTHMIQHLRTHTGERPFWCTECDSRFTTSGQLQRHIQAVHQGLKKFKCDICGKEFLYSHNYKAHIQRHEGNKELNCELCEKSFFTKNALFRHKRFHTGEKPFQCDICGKKFADCSNRKRHRLQHHKANTITSDDQQLEIIPTDTNDLGIPVKVVLLDTTDHNTPIEGDKTFTNLRSLLMEDFLQVQRANMALVRQDKESPQLVSISNNEESELTLAVEDQNNDLTSSLQNIDVDDSSFNLDSIATNISSSLDDDDPVDLSSSLTRSPLHITPPSLRNSPTNMENSSLADLSPSLQPISDMPTSDFLLTLQGY